MADNESKSSTDLDKESISSDTDSKRLEEQEREKTEKLVSVNEILKIQLPGLSVHKIAVEWSGYDQNRVRINFWDDRALTMVEPSVRLLSDSLSPSAKCDTLENLALLLSKAAPVENQEHYSKKGGWINVDSCPATIRSCEASVNDSHVTTGRGTEFVEGGTRHGEMHFAGPCAIAIDWKYWSRDSKCMHDLSFRLEAIYTKIMWDPRDAKWKRNG